MGKPIIPPGGKPASKNSKSSAEEPWSLRYLRERGVDLSKVPSVLLTLSPDSIIFHALHPLTGQRIPGSSQTRHKNPVMRNGELRKFTFEKGGTSSPFFPADPKLNHEVAKDPKRPIVVSEGPTRELAFIPTEWYAIALAGVDAQGQGDSLPALLDLYTWKGRTVYVMFDSDAANNPRVQAAEQRLARKLTARGALVSITRTPPIAGPHTGADDILGLPGGREMLAHILAASAPFGHAAVQIEPLSAVEAKPVPWLWKPYLAFGQLALLSGDPSAGKTFIGLAIAASFSRGRVPYSKERCEPINTLFVSNENATAYVVRPRVDALGGDPKRIFVLKEAITLSDTARLRAALIDTKAKLLIVDPLQSFLGADVDMHRSNETRPVLDNLVREAEELGVCVLIVRHLAKSSGGRAIHRGLGSIDITGTARTEWLAGSAADQPNVRALVPIKNNIGPLGPSLGYEIKGSDAAACLHWLGSTSLTAADLTAPPTAAHRRPTQVDRACDYLRKALAEGPRPCKAVEEECDGEFALQVLQKASTALGLVKTRKGEGGAWVWALPDLKFARNRGGDDTQG